MPRSSPASSRSTTAFATRGAIALKDQARTIAGLLRNRGFSTGAAVSSFLLRRSPDSRRASRSTTRKSRTAARGRRAAGAPGAATFDAADAWIKSQSGQRYFLFLQVDARSADAVVGRLVDELKRTKRYNDSTIVLTADHGDPGDGTTLDDASLRVPLIVKQPGEAGAGRRVPLPVQHIDVLPTLLDLVRAPMPSGLRGRSLRTILDKTSGFVPDQPIYAELLAPQFRFDGQPLFALSNASYRFVRGIAGDVQPLVPDAPNPDALAYEQMRRRARQAARGTCRRTRPHHPRRPTKIGWPRSAIFGSSSGTSRTASHPSHRPSTPLNRRR